MWRRLLFLQKTYESIPFHKKREPYYTNQLKHALGHNIPVLPIKLCEEWPPAQCGIDGAKQNIFVFKPDLLYEDWSDKTWDPKKCAEDIKASLDQMELTV